MNTFMEKKKKNVTLNGIIKNKIEEKVHFNDMCLNRLKKNK